MENYGDTYKVREYKHLNIYSWKCLEECFAFPIDFWEGADRFIEEAKKMGIGNKL